MLLSSQPSPNTDKFFCSLTPPKMTNTSASQIRLAILLPGLSLCQVRLVISTQWVNETLFEDSCFMEYANIYPDVRDSRNLNRHKHKNLRPQRF